MVVRNAITDLFDVFSGITLYNGFNRAKILKELLVKEVPLNKDTDAPIPLWLITLLINKRIGYKERIRIALLHHRDITGEHIKTSLLNKKTNRVKSPAFYEV